MQPTPRPEGPAAGAERRLFSELPSQDTVDSVLRTIQQGLAHFSAMADAKANILITVSALVFSVGLTQLGSARFHAAVLVLLSGSALALVLAILCALPRRYVPRDDVSRDLLFFQHFAGMGVERYLDAMDELLADTAALTEAVVRDIHAQGVAIARSKYRFLYWSYLTLIAAIAACAALVAAEMLLA